MTRAAPTVSAMNSTTKSRRQKPTIALTRFLNELADSAKFRIRTNPERARYVEAEFDVRIPTADRAGLETVGALVSYVALHHPPPGESLTADELREHVAAVLGELLARERLPPGIAQLPLQHLADRTPWQIRPELDALGRAHAAELGLGEGDQRLAQLIGHLLRRRRVTGARLWVMDGVEHHGDID